MHTYEARVIADQATGRPLAGIRVTVEDAETGAPVQPYRDGAPVQLVTGTYGLITEWQTEDTTRRVALTAGPVRLTQWCSEIMGGAQDAADRAEAAARGLTADNYVSATNLVHNGDFTRALEGWSYYGSTASIIPDAVAATGSGAISGVGLYTAPGYRRVAKGGHRLYVEARMRVRTAGATTLRVELSDGVSRLNAAEVKPPSLDLWTIVRGVTTVPASFDGRELQVYAAGYWPDRSAASGAVVEIDHVMAIDLTETYGAGVEPNAAEVAARIQELGGFFDGTEPLFAQVARFIREDEAQALIDARIKSLPVTTRSAGPPVIFRFDDGYVNNLTLAAPLLARHGYSATLYAVTRPAEWAGAPMPMMTPAQWKELHDRWGWDIASHVTAHQDSTVGDPAVWAERLRESCDDIVQAGLPWPRTLAYPNGSRTAATDRYVARLFQVCGLTGHPSKIPVDRHARTFFTGWTTVNGLNPAPGIAQLKSYVRAATNRGEVPILGFHGITDGAPPAAHHMSLATLTEIVEWLASQGYSSMLMGDLLPQNLLADPGFEEHAIGQFPWITSGGGWSRTRSTAAGHTGWYGADLLTGGAGLLSQTAPVDPGQTYRVRVRFGAGRTITGGRVDVVAIPQAPTGSPVGPTLTVGTMTEGPTEADVTGLVTMPAGASVLKVGVQPVGFTGSGVRVVHAALSRSDFYDPLA